MIETFFVIEYKENFVLTAALLLSMQWKVHFMHCIEKHMSCRFTADFFGHCVPYHFLLMVNCIEWCTCIVFLFFDVHATYSENILCV